MRGFLVKSPGSFDRVGCEAGHGEREHPGRRTEVGCNENPTSAVSPSTTSARRRFRIAAVARDRCSVKGAVASDQAGSDIGMPLFQASMQEGRFHFELRGGAADEVARISDIMCKAAQQWQREVAVGVMPSMVTNSVS